MLRRAGVSKGGAETRAGGKEEVGIILKDCKEELRLRENWGEKHAVMRRN